MDSAVRDTKISRLVREIDVLIEADEASDRRITGGWQTFDDIVAAAHVHTWDAYSVDLAADAASFHALDTRQQEAVRRVFGTIYRVESVVDDWMDKIVAAVPREPGYESMRAALMTQEHDERMHRGSLLRVADEVLGIPPEDADRFARRYNNFVAEILFDDFERLMRDLLRRDEGRHVRIAVLATRRFLAEQGEAAAERLLDIAVYYMDLKRLAARLDELGLRASVLEVRTRVDAAIEELSENGELVVETPSRWLRVVGPRVMRFAGTARLAD